MVKRRRRQGKAVRIPSTSTVKQDLISRLPDEVLTHTLSFLPTESAVATSLLSKRWKDVWISAPSLEFSNCWSSCPVKIDLIQNFIDRVMSINNVSSVRKIYLHCLRGFDVSRVNAWISSIARRDAEELELYFGPQINSIPDSFFHKEKLVRLILGGIVLKVPPLVCFPNLKSINLVAVEFSVDDSMKNLLLGCPVLWSLDISLKWVDNAHMLYISSATLHKLDISSMSEKFSIKFVIDTPNLSILRITDFSETSSYEFINVSSLTKATLCLETIDGILIDVFADIAHVRDLSLLAWSSLIHTWPMFHNLVRFEIDLYIGLEVLPLMFHGMPKLVTFILDLSDQDETSSGWCDPNEVPHCFLYCIENVEIRRLGEGVQEIQMIAYILKYAMVLKNLVIRPVSMDFDDEKKLLKTLLNLPRSSMACQVDYVETVCY